MDGRSDSDERKKTILVITGAAGFMGEHSLKFALDKYAAVIATDIKPVPFFLDRNKKTDDLFFVKADLTQKKELGQITAAVKKLLDDRPDYQAVIWHEGGLFRYGAPEETLDRINVGGTRNLVDAVALPLAEKLKSFVFWSGLTVFGSFDFPLPTTENSPRKPSNSYGWSKLRAEELLLGSHEKYGLPAVIMELGAVYGPGGPSNERYGMAVLVKQFADGTMPNIFVGNQRRVALVHVEDVIRTADFLGFIDEAVGRRFLVVDDCPHTAEEISELLGEETENPLLKGIKMPQWMFEYLINEIDRVSKKYDVRSEIDKGLAEMVLLNSHSSNAELMDLARRYGRGRNSKNPLLKHPDSFVGLKQTAAEYKKEGWI